MHLPPRLRANPPEPGVILSSAIYSGVGGLRPVCSERELLQGDCLARGKAETPPRQGAPGRPHRAYRGAGRLADGHGAHFFFFFFFYRPFGKPHSRNCGGPKPNIYIAWGGIPPRPLATLKLDRRALGEALPGWVPVTRLGSNDSVWHGPARGLIRPQLAAFPEPKNQGHCERPRPQIYGRGPRRPTDVKFLRNHRGDVALPTSSARQQNLGRGIAGFRRQGGQGHRSGAAKQVPLMHSFSAGPNHVRDSAPTGFGAARLTPGNP